MPDKPEPAAEIRNWMLGVLSETGLSPAAWAKRAGVAGSTVQRAIKPGYAFVTSSRTIAKLASAAGRAPPEVRQTAEIQLVPQFLPVRFKVRAGLWEEIGSEEPIDEFTYAVLPDPRFADWPQWLELVEGDSVDKEIPAGHLAHVVDAIEMGYAPQHEDFVVVERRRDQGAIRERTIKQIEVKADVIELWPRSTNPKWQTPVELCGGARASEEIEVEVVGLVIGSYNPKIFKRR